MEKKPQRYNQIRIVNYEDDIHCMPQDDWFEHVADANCQCSPQLDPKNLEYVRMGQADKYVWVHNQIKYSKEFLN